MPQIYIIKYIPFENNTAGYPWLYSGSDMKRQKIKSRCVFNDQIVTEKQYTTDPFLNSIEDCVGKQFKELGFYRLTIQEWKLKNEIF